MVGVLVGRELGLTGPQWDGLVVSGGRARRDRDR